MQVNSTCGQFEQLLHMYPAQLTLALLSLSTLVLSSSSVCSWVSCCSMEKCASCRTPSSRTSEMATVLKYAITGQLATDHGIWCTIVDPGLCIYRPHQAGWTVRGTATGYFNHAIDRNKTPYLTVQCTKLTGRACGDHGDIPLMPYFPHGVGRKRGNLPNGCCCLVSFLIYVIMFHKPLV